MVHQYPVVAPDLPACACHGPLVPPVPHPGPVVDRVAPPLCETAPPTQSSRCSRSPSAGTLQRLGSRSRQPNQHHQTKSITPRPSPDGYADRGLGLDEKLPAEGRLRPTARARSPTGAFQARSRYPGHVRTSWGIAPLLVFSLVWFPRVRDHVQEPAIASDGAGRISKLVRRAS